MYSRIPIKDNEEYDLRKLHEMIEEDYFFDYSDIIEVMKSAQEYFNDEPNLIELESENAIIVGDVHGNYDAFWENIKSFDPEKNHLIMLGDYVDRGTRSIQILITICCMKINTPDRVHILRGNHETYKVCMNYGFYIECEENYDDDMFELWNDFFCTLPIAMTLKTKKDNYFLCHGGITEEIKDVKQINQIPRKLHPSKNNIFYHLLWNDPVENEMMNNNVTFIKANRGYKFGPAALKPFLKSNQLTCLIRAHQYVPKGIRFQRFDSLSPNCITIFGVPDYCHNNNKAAVIIIENSTLSHKTIDLSSNKPKEKIFDFTSTQQQYEQNCHIKESIEDMIIELEKIQPKTPIQPIKPILPIYPIQPLVPKEKDTNDMKELIEDLSTIANKMDETQLQISKDEKENNLRFEANMKLFEEMSSKLSSYSRKKRMNLTLSDELHQSLELDSSFESKNSLFQSFDISIVQAKRELSIDEMNSNVYDLEPITFEELQQSWNQLKEELNSLKKSTQN